MENCSHCWRQIGNAEPKYLHDEQVICRECHDMLSPRCPYCGHELAPPVEDQTPCPSCRREICVDRHQHLFPSSLLTREQLDALQDYRAFLVPAGVCELDYIEAERRLEKERGKITPEEVIDSLMEHSGSHKEGSRPSFPGGYQPPAEDEPMVTQAELEAELQRLEGGENQKPTVVDAQAQSAPAAKTKDLPTDPQKLQQEFAHRGFSLLKPFDISLANFLHEEHILRAQYKRQPSAAEVLRNLTQKVVNSAQDSQQASIMLHEMALLFHQAGENSHTLQRDWARMHLEMLREDGVRRVKIESLTDACPVCVKANGVELSIDRAIRELPIPHPHCQHFLKKGDRYPWCRCDYAPVEQEDASATGEFEALVEDEEFSSFLDSLEDDE